MRILFVPLGSASHYFPMVPLAWAFRTAGHDVRIAAQAPAIRAILESGMPAIRVGDSFDLHAMLSQADEALHRASGRPQAEFDTFAEIPAEALREWLTIRSQAHVRTAEAMGEDLIPFARAWRPDLVVSDPATLAGPLVASAVGARLVMHAWGTRTPAAKVPNLDEFRATLFASMKALYERFDAELKPGVAGAVTVVPCPPSLQGDTSGDPIVCRHVPYNGSGVEPAWLHQPVKRPRVLISGSMFFGAGTANWEGSHFTALARSVAALDVEVVVTTDASVRLSPALAADNIRVVNLLPLRSVLPSCSAAVSHGGSGTLLAAASFGVPQVLLPRQQEHVGNAESVAAAGAGAWYRADRFDVEEVTETLKSMIFDDRWRAAALRLKQENDLLPTPPEIVRRLAQLP